MKLGYQEWIVAYERGRGYKDAEKLYNHILQSSEQLNLEIKEPSWFELPKESDPSSFRSQLTSFIQSFGVPLILVLVLKNEALYSVYKNICYEQGVISQVVTARSCFKMNMSLASTVLRQVNSKGGGDLYNIEIPKEVDPSTMFIGIDVCHKGRKSIVGFCASINLQYSQYYSQRIIQKKGQEIVTNELAGCLESAILAFKDRHPKKFYPAHFIIYRDGVGDAMRKQVLQNEIA